MSIRRRKKAISKVVKLLNLATSSNPSEAQMALRHAETIVRQNSVSRSEVPLSALCDPATLNKVNWGAKSSSQPSYTPKYARTSAAAQSQFKEQPVDKNHSYAGARTILDEEYVTEADFDPIKAAAQSNLEREEEEKRKQALKAKAKKEKEAAKRQEEEEKEKAKQALQAAREKAEQDRLKAAAEQQAERERLELERYAAQAQIKMQQEQAKQDEETSSEDLAVLGETLKQDDETVSQVAEIEQAQTLNNTESNQTQNREEKEQAQVDVAMDNTYQGAPTSADNVINAANAFRPEGFVFSEKLREQYAASDPSVPFEDDEYWQKIQEQLAAFDEAKVQGSIETIENQLLLSKESLAEKRQLRLDAEQEELSERAERARIELSFEEAIERAFQARAKAYEAWEKQRSEIRVECLRSEQEAQHGFEELTQDLEKVKSDYKLHLKQKEDFHAAKIMHELRCHLALAVSVTGEGKDSFDKVVNIMSEAGLTLKDLEFSDIKNKSLFIRLLERETASIEDVVARESHTEEMLSKFLSSTLTKREKVKTENPLQLIEKLLAAASLGSQFEAQKSIEQAFHLMEVNGISVRDIDLTKITKYSVFVRLLNWEAEKISSLTEREKFTASILEEYVTSSIQGDVVSRDKVGKNKA
ncbi:DUF2786 domain-containing protein [Marinomonas sp. MED121]|uniref:DUF2786 domain-containing protein n=1 Tax=Marinomonas sp. MED121 TaxID=314277 RepID=UPI000682AFD0|nr:DUF2786 domain-containing protein [Marinomonas sp. MED121]